MKKDDSIKLHPEHGLNPTILICPICRDKDKSTSLALLGYNKNKKASMYSLGQEPCKDCMSYMDEYITFLVIHDEISKERTGDIIRVKKNTAQRLLPDIDISKPVYHIGVDLADALKKIHSNIKQER